MKVSFMKNMVCRIDDEPNFGSMIVTVAEMSNNGGRLTIENAGQTHAVFWPRTAGDSFLQAVLDSSVDLLAAEIAKDVPQQIFDYESVARMVKRRIVTARRNRVTSAEEARKLFNESRYIGVDEMSIDEKLVASVLGKDWWSMVPVHENPTYREMCEMVRVVQKALKLTQGTTPGKVTDEDGERIKTNLAWNKQA